MRVTKASLAHNASRPTEANTATMSGVSTSVSLRRVRTASPSSSTAASPMASASASRSSPPAAAASPGTSWAADRRPVANPLPSISRTSAPAALCTTSKASSATTPSSSPCTTTVVASPGWDTAASTTAASAARSASTTPWATASASRASRSSEREARLTVGRAVATETRRLHEVTPRSPGCHVARGALPGTGRMTTVGVCGFTLGLNGPSPLRAPSAGPASTPVIQPRSVVRPGRLGRTAHRLRPYGPGKRRRTGADATD